MLKFFILVSFFACAVIFQTTAHKSKERALFLSPPKNIKYFTLGYNDFLASSLWVRLQQDFDYCEGGRFQGSDFVKPLAGPDVIDGILQRKMKDSKCHQGWVFKMLEAISEIQPQFKLVYDMGATFLSVYLDDREGARLMFDKGLVLYPKDWELNFRAGYHYLWEMQDPKKAAELLKVSWENGAPPFVAALSAALYTKTGQAQFAKVILEDAIKRKPTGFGADRIQIRLDEVNKILKENP